MTIAGDLARCSQCRLSFPDGLAARRHEQLDHTPAPDGALLLQQLLAAPPLPEDARSRPPVPSGPDRLPEDARFAPDAAGALPGGGDLGARLALLLVVSWVVGFLALLVLLS